MPTYKNSLKILISAVVILAIVIVYFLLRKTDIIGGSGRSVKVMAWIRNPESYPDWAVKNGQRCDGAPFILPSDGFIGYLWGDTFNPSSRHQGIDIFAGTQVGQTPVVAVYDGYLTRLDTWKSSVILRIPNDPVSPGRQIWVYFTHMADEQGKSLISDAFPAGTNDMPVKAGTLLGYQGNYSGEPGNPVGVHLHLSIVLDNGQGKFRDERDIRNTVDPSEYFGINLNVDNQPADIPVCR